MIEGARAKRGAAVAALAVAGVLAVAGCGGSSSSSSSSSAAKGPPAPTGAQAHDAQLVSGRSLYRSFCAECHGMQGQGGVGPELRNGAVTRAFPDIDDQIALVENGRGLMPAWKGKLSDAQIRSVVRYEREVL